METKTNYIIEYINSIESGEILVGEKLMRVLSMLKSDIESGKYEFDSAGVNRRINFIESVVKLTKSPYYGKPMKLMLWQKAFISALYGFKMKDGTDRFQRALLLVARKNTKSETCSALALQEFIAGNAGSDIVCASNDDNQASILYSAVDTMRMMIDPKQKDTWRSVDCLKNLRNNSRIFKMSVRTRNKEGRNIDFAVIDECHEMADNSIVKAIEQSQSLKENPKLIMITTEGFVIGGFLDKEMQRVDKMLEILGEGGELNSADERFLPWIYSQDSEHEVWQGNEKNKLWMKSNPTIGEIKKWGYMEQQVQLARDSAEDRAYVLAKDFNIKQTSSRAWLRYDDFMYDSGFDIEEFRGQICLCGVDLSETTDLCSAKILLLRPDDKKKYIYGMYWIPEKKLIEDEADSRQGADYSEWVKDGIMRISGENYINTADVADWFLELYRKYSIRPYKCGYDVRFSNDFVTRMNDYGLDSEVVWQNAPTLSNPIKMLETDLRSQNVVGLNDCDKWCIANSELYTDSKGFNLLIKAGKNPSKRIDGAVSAVILYEMYRRYRSEFSSITGRGA